MSSKGQIVLPAQLRADDGLVAGQQFDIERLESGQYLLRKMPPAGEPGLVSWLRSCPAEDWFEPLPFAS
jgi:AbrB family looped-hinge helix DNA binding protein